MRVLALTRYGVMGASTRLRFIQYFAALAEENIQVHWQPLINDNYLKHKYTTGRLGWRHLIFVYFKRIRTLVSQRNFDVIWIEKEALPFFPTFIEAILLRRVPYVLDYDDAIFHNYDKSTSVLVRYFLGKRIDKLMSGAKLVVCGSSYIAQRARESGSPRVVELPTVVDIDRYPKTSGSYSDCFSRLGTPLRIVWIGSPSTAKCLEVLKKPLSEVAKRVPFIFRVIGAHFSLPGVKTECFPWSQDSEVAKISECDLGVMPLFDSPWERGKCGYKLIQYMACELPVIASDIGMNAEIVKPGVNGFLVSSDDEWVVALENLLLDSLLRRKFGEEGRKHVENNYCLQSTTSKLTRLLFEASEAV